MKKRQVLARLIKLGRATPVDGHNVPHKYAKKRKSPKPQIIVQIVECACKCQPDSTGTCSNPECESNHGCGSDKTSQSDSGHDLDDDPALSQDASSTEEEEIIDAGYDMHVTLGDLHSFIEAVTGPARVSKIHIATGSSEAEH